MISLPELRARNVTPIWQEAVAVVQELIQTVKATTGTAELLPDLEHVALIPNGDVVALPGSPQPAVPVRHAAVLLQLLDRWRPGAAGTGAVHRPQHRRAAAVRHRRGVLAQPRVLRAAGTPLRRRASRLACRGRGADQPRRRGTAAPEGARGGSHAGGHAAGLPAADDEEGEDRSDRRGRGGRRGGRRGSLVAVAAGECSPVARLHAGDRE